MKSLHNNSHPNCCTHSCFWADNQKGQGSLCECFWECLSRKGHLGISVSACLSLQTRSYLKIVAWVASVSFEKAPVRSNSKSFPQNSFPHNIVPIFQSPIDELEDSTTFKTVKDVDRKGICYHFDQTNPDPIKKCHVTHVGHRTSPWSKNLLLCRCDSAIWQG